ncbi:hypothetical protein DFH07DRAFT_952344 [Mycena maculata]|uniref:Ribonuclease H1 N-terminal domain-containing protein n=1 Tax=Mycena maculata TaxID=230809 RepID=A0AAD7JYJ4_9AGAR|nr:hypothetical protein DFH07DRAFT_952344 [Mycena maculata]
MAPFTAAQIADFLRAPASAAPLGECDLERLTDHLTDHEFEELAEHLGLRRLAEQFPPLFVKLILAAQRAVRESPPEYPDSVDELIRDFDISSLDEHFSSSAPTATPPPSSPEPPITPIKQRTTHTAPSTPQTGDQRQHEYIVRSPAQNGGAPFRTTEWFSASALGQGIRGASVRLAPGSNNKKSRKRRSAAFVVFYGGTIGVFEAWGDVVPAITGHGIALYAGFPSHTAANAALAYARSKGWTGDSQPPRASDTTFLLPSSYEDNPLNTGVAGTGLWYAVCRGVVPGIYRSYLECGLNISGIPGSLFRSFDTREDAETAFKRAREEGLVRVIPRTTPI